MRAKSENIPFREICTSHDEMFANDVMAAGAFMVEIKGRKLKFKQRQYAQI